MVQSEKKIISLIVELNFNWSARVSVYRNLYDIWLDRLETAYLFVTI
jgi:hypothetical protein